MPTYNSFLAFSLLNRQIRNWKGYIRLSDPICYQGPRSGVWWTWCRLQMRNMTWFSSSSPRRISPATAWPCLDWIGRTNLFSNKKLLQNIKSETEFMWKIYWEQFTIQKNLFIFNLMEKWRNKTLQNISPQLDNWRSSTELQPKQTTESSGSLWDPGPLQD